MEVGAGALVMVELFGDEVVVQETMMIMIEGGVGVASEVHMFEEIRVSSSLRTEEEEAVMNTSDSSFACPGYGEASSS